MQAVVFFCLIVCTCEKTCKMWPRSWSHWLIVKIFVFLYNMDYYVRLFLVSISIKGGVHVKFPSKPKINSTLSFNNVSFIILHYMRIMIISSKKSNHFVKNLINFWQEKKLPQSSSPNSLHNFLSFYDSFMHNFT